jgi:hypothetical protein
MEMMIDRKVAAEENGRIMRWISRAVPSKLNYVTSITAAVFKKCNPRKGVELNLE